MEMRSRWFERLTRDCIDRGGLAGLMYEPDVVYRFVCVQKRKRFMFLLLSLVVLYIVMMSDGDSK